jgi:hypothetical protein
MVNVNYYDLNSVDDNMLFCATIMAKYQDKWRIVKGRVYE